MAAKSRPYWLTVPCRLSRHQNTLRVETYDERTIHLPIEDISEIICAEPVDINTSAVSLLSRYEIVVHLLDHYGNYAGCLLGAEHTGSAPIVAAQAAAIADPARRIAVAKRIVTATARTLRWSIGSDHLDRPLKVLLKALPEVGDVASLMGIEGNYRRTTWAIVDTHLPLPYRLSGRHRRPPTNAGNAFISYANGITYSTALSALRTGPLTPILGFLHSNLERNRFPLALDLAEMFKPLFAERLLIRMANLRQLKDSDFELDAASASLSHQGRRKIIKAVRDELETKVHHRGLKRKVTYRELLALESHKIVSHILEEKLYRAFVPWW